MSEKAPNFSLWDEETKKEVLLLGRVIAIERRKKGLTQDELGQKYQLSQNMISLVEQGFKNPTYLTLSKIAKGLGVPLSKIFKEVEELKEQEK